MVIDKNTEINELKAVSSVYSQYIYNIKRTHLTHVG